MADANAITRYQNHAKTSHSASHSDAFGLLKDFGEEILRCRPGSFVRLLIITDAGDVMAVGCRVGERVLGVAVNINLIIGVHFLHLRLKRRQLLGWYHGVGSAVADEDLALDLIGALVIGSAQRAVKRNNPGQWCAGAGQFQRNCPQNNNRWLQRGFCRHTSAAAGYRAPRWFAAAWWRDRW